MTDLRIHVEEFKQILPILLVTKTIMMIKYYTFAVTLAKQCQMLQIRKGTFTSVQSLF